MRAKQCVLVFMVTVMMCLLLGMSALSLQSFSRQITFDSGLRVFLEEEASAQFVVQELNVLDGVMATNYMDKEQALADFQATLGYAWDGVNPLPDMVEVIVHPSNASRVYAQIQEIKGIEYTSYPTDAFEKIAWFTTLSETISRVLLVLTTAIGGFGMLWVIRKAKGGGNPCAS